MRHGKHLEKITAEKIIIKVTFLDLQGEDEAGGVIVHKFQT